MDSGNIRGLRLLDVPTSPAEVLGLGRLSLTGIVFSVSAVATSCTDPFCDPIVLRGGKVPFVGPEGIQGGGLGFWALLVDFVFLFFLVKSNPNFTSSE